jgi:hypothetical protein
LPQLILLLRRKGVLWQRGRMTSATPYIAAPNLATTYDSMHGMRWVKSKHAAWNDMKEFLSATASVK